jgi:Spy/CpxP family protein refolding chaperone
VTFLLAAVLSVPMGLSEAAAAQDPETAPGLEPAPTRGGRGARRGAAGRADIMTVQQVEEYFDQVMLHQARANLSLTPDQFLRFGACLRRLQMARRQQQRRRVALVRELNALTSRSPIDEASVSAKLEELDRAAGEASDDTRAAYAAIDRVLDLRQRARFRVFEEMMERRKLDLVARARQQAARAGAPEP